MPIIEIHVLQGYDAAQKTRLCKALTNAARTVIPATPDAVTVMIKEMPATDYMRGGQHRSPAPALPDAPSMVARYLRHRYRPHAFRRRVHHALPRCRAYDRA